MMRDMVMVLGRVLMAAVFVVAGLSDLIWLSGTVEHLRSLGLPLPWVSVWIVLSIEILCGVAIIVGYRTRWAASILALFLITAGLIAHFDFGSAAEIQLLMKDIAIAGGLFYIAANGAGLISLDASREA
jgi:putative oxidoreductase